MSKQLSKSRITQLTSKELSRARNLGQITDKDFRKAMKKIWKQFPTLYQDWFG